MEGSEILPCSRITPQAQHYQRQCVNGGEKTDTISLLSLLKLSLKDWQKFVGKSFVSYPFLKNRTIGRDYAMYTLRTPLKWQAIKSNFYLFTVLM